MNSIGLRHLSVVRRTVVRMSSTNSSYEDAIRKLNSLQSNKSTIEQIKKGLKTGQKCTNLEDMENYLRRIGIPLSKLDELSVIHVAGTKGKGSTSAMCESILRQHGFRTGFYSSPHLVEARERIRLDGRPLCRAQFAESLHHVYGMLWDSQEFEGDMPKYFAFLTAVALHEFLRRRVDVAVVEVGIGGVVDYTNVLRKVPVVGITALGLDHTSILGHTLPEIAAAKAGVMKRGCRAYTVRQPSAAHRVLAAYADRMECPLTVVPDYTSYTFPESETSYLPIDLDAYRTNASLAIQLSHAWMRATQANHIQDSVKKHANKIQNGLHSTISNGIENGVKNNQKKDPARSQNDTNINQNSISNGDIASHWQANVNSIHNEIDITNYSLTNTDQNTSLYKMTEIRNGIQNEDIHFRDKDHDGLIKDNINAQNSRNVSENGIHKIVNGTYKGQNGLINGDEMDILVYDVPYETAVGLRQCKWPGRYHVIDGDYAKFYLDGAHTKESMEICAQWFLDTSSAAKTLIFSATGDRNAETLLQPLSRIPFKNIYFVIPTAHKVTSTIHDNYSLVEQEELIQRCRNHAQFWQRNNSTTEITVLECVEDALVSIKANGQNPSVLITGSLHLVGAALSILDPNLST